MSQEELASQITVSRQAVSKWELGESIPDTENVIQLCRLFRVSADYLLNDDVESDMDIPVVRENSDKLKKKYNLIVSFVVIGLFFIFLIVLGILNQSIIVVFIGVIFIIFFVLGLLVSKVLKKHQKK